MKKMILLAAGAVLLVAAVSAFVYVKNENNAMNELFDTNVEALSDCEITTEKGKVLFSCRGENTCSATYLGKTLTCDGTKL